MMHSSISASQPLGKLLVLFLVVGLLAGCGRKPAQLEAPAGANPASYPKTYPPMDDQ